LCEEGVSVVPSDHECRRKKSLMMSIPEFIPTNKKKASTGGGLEEVMV
jgi:hypothetical protein